jgi:hypothetical protein
MFFDLTCPLGFGWGGNPHYILIVMEPGTAFGDIQKITRPFIKRRGFRNDGMKVSRCNVRRGWYTRNKNFHRSIVLPEPGFIGMDYDLKHLTIDDHPSPVNQGHPQDVSGAIP